MAGTGISVAVWGKSPMVHGYLQRRQDCVGTTIMAQNPLMSLSGTLMLLAFMACTFPSTMASRTLSGHNPFTSVHGQRPGALSTKHHRLVEAPHASM